MPTAKSLPIPTARMIEHYYEKFCNSPRYFRADAALLMLFRTFPRNKRLDDILLKISVLNDLYGTNIYATFQMAQHIQRLAIDRRLAKGDAEVVEQIAKAKFGKKPRRVYSFATKYCSWHDQAKYPIFDGFVEKVLWSYRNQDQFCEFRREDLRHYGTFRQIFAAFRHYYDLERFDFKKIDKALWLLGKERFPKQ